MVSVFADFDTPIVAVRGNCDAEVDLMLLPFAVEDSAVIAADGLRIVAQHGHHPVSYTHLGGAIIVVDKEESPGGYPATVLSRLTWDCKLRQGAEPGAVMRKELSLSGVQQMCIRDRSWARKGRNW